jgi:hypothetical protein
VITRRVLATVQGGLLAFGALGVTLVTAPSHASASVTACPAPSVSASTATVTCSYTGDLQTWTVPAGVTSASFDVFGAQGGSEFANAGGGGGEASATGTVTPAAVMTVAVGGRGSANTAGGAGGFNGGGNGGTNLQGAGGGGASDVRSGGSALTDRILVAGGGGGHGLSIAAGGAGGGLSGTAGGTYVFGGGGGGGGTQLAVGGGGASGCCGAAGSPGTGASGGQGGSASAGIGGGGGGGGFFGGGGGGDQNGGGGGSGTGPAGTAYNTGVRGGNGLVVITYTLRTTTVAVSCAPGATTVAIGTTCTATVTDTDSGTAVTPTGTVTFASAGTGAFDHTTCPNGPPATTSSTMSCSVVYTPSVVGTGTHTISVAYAGDLSTAASSSSGAQNAAVTVTQGLTTTALGTSASSAAVGQPVTYTATISVTAPGSGTPTGTLGFTDNTVTIAGCGAVAIAGGHATCAATYLVTGGHSIIATYSGDTNFLSSHDSLAESIVTASTTTVLGTSVATSIVGAPITLTGTVAVVAPGSGVPAGSVAFKDGTATVTGCGAQPLDVSGVATCTAGFSTAAVHSITAVYAGSLTHAGSTSAPVVDTVTPAATTVTVGASPAQATVGTPVTISVTVKAVAPGAGNPTGTVTVLVDGVPFGTAPLDSTIDSLALLTTTALTPGTHQVTATYGGDANYTASVSAVAAPQRAVPGVPAPAAGATGGRAALGLLTLPQLGVALMLLGGATVACGSRRRSGAARALRRR